MSNGYLYGGAFTDENCTKPAFQNGAACTGFNPSWNTTYYIWEVDQKYLVSKTASVWHHGNGGAQTVTQLYLMTVVDRLLYKEVGFDMSNNGATGKSRRCGICKTLPEYIDGGTDMIYTLQTDVALVTVCDENFLNILRTALHHEQVWIQLPGNQWKKILEISIKQHLLSVIVEVIPWKFHRISADNDLHISGTELLACHHAMLAYGLHTETPEECLEQEDEITYQDEKKRLYIEVHRSLFDTSDEAPDNLNIFFKDAVKNAVEMDGFFAMPPHEHFLYLLLHAYKHFIYSGVGIRQTCDIALWVQRYAG